MSPAGNKILAFRRRLYCLYLEPAVSASKYGQDDEAVVIILTLCLEPAVSAGKYGQATSP